MIVIQVGECWINYLINQFWIDNNQLLGIIININYGPLLLSIY
jgi:hypothetical protein